MRYRLSHRTTYRYDQPVTFAQCVLRLTPPSNARQTTTEARVDVSPAPAAVKWRTGPYGEPTQRVRIDEPHTRLVITSTARVEVHALRPKADGRSWEAVRAEAMSSCDMSATGPAAFLYPTAATPLVPAITDYVRTSFPPGRPLLEAAEELMRRIQRDFIYDGKATDVTTPAATAFAARRGVCQDFAHIMICGLRGLGLPAAYVSGYLRTVAPEGRPRLVGADATHAWVELWCGEAVGWAGFDPTNALLALDDHVVLAVGRDYADAAPIKGLILTPGAQSLTVEVDLAPEFDEVSARLTKA